MVHNLPEEGRRRVVVERVAPQINGGRFPIKRTVGESVVVEADVFTDGHDRIHCQLQYRNENSPQWHTELMKPLGNDRWQGAFPVRDLGRYLYTVSARIDHFL
ncbi:MAG TPA: DUF3416 domain-containing protein, partial [Nitrosomonas sp.]|nr:DUF3416 domain-containing protein [Nitrosomonas sp.]